MRARISIAAALAALIFAGCPAPPKLAGTCTTGAECAGPDLPGAHCVDGHCVACRDDGDCGDGESCDVGRCEVMVAACDCASTERCADGQCLPIPCYGSAECPLGLECSEGQCAMPGGPVAANSEMELEERWPAACLAASGGDDVHLESIRFDLDMAELTEESREALAQGAECLNTVDELSIVIEGHCDERGTSEYNLGLGDRRARVVADYLRLLGVERDRVLIISKGEEEPVCYDPGEDCWQRNRRVDLIPRQSAEEVRTSSR